MMIAIRDANIMTIKLFSIFKSVIPCMRYRQIIIVYYLDALGHDPSPHTQPQSHNIRTPSPIQPLHP